MAHKILRLTLFSLLIVCLALANSSLDGAQATETISILFGGDTSYGENYQEGYAAKGRENILATRGYDYSIAGLKDLLAASDLNILNLETPLTSMKRSPLTEKDLCHYSHPRDATAALKKHHVHVVSLANNHAMDFGSQGLDETLKSLDHANIKSFGAGRNEQSASQAYTNKLRLADQHFHLAVIGAFEYREAYEPYNFYAKGDQPGTNPIDAERITRQIAALKKKHPSLFVVVFPHWGGNYVWRSKRLQNLAHQFIDAGADLVVGHGAHCIQEIEKYRDRWIFYSIGNFMFNSGGRYGKLNAPPYSMPLVLRVSVADGNVSKTLRAYPIVSDNRQTDYQPRLVDPKEFKEVRDLLVEHSTETNLERLFTAGEDDLGAYLELIAD